MVSKRDILIRANDSFSRRHEDILRVFDAAIEKAP